jgi:hypothetical protein
MDERQGDRPTKRLSRRRFIASSVVAAPGIAAIGALAPAAPSPTAPVPSPSPGLLPDTGAPTNATYLVQTINPKLPNAIVVGEPVPRLHVNALSGGATDTDPYRGSVWQPYATLEQALMEANGKAGSYSNLIGSTQGTRWSVDIEIGPGRRRGLRWCRPRSASALGSLTGRGRAAGRCRRHARRVGRGRGPPRRSG